MLGGDRRDDRLRAVAAGHRQRVGAARDRARARAARGRRRASARSARSRARAPRRRARSAPPCRRPTRVEEQHRVLRRGAARPADRRGRRAPRAPRPAHDQQPATTSSGEQRAARDEQRDRGGERQRGDRQPGDAQRARAAARRTRPPPRRRSTQARSDQAARELLTATATASASVAAPTTSATPPESSSHASDSSRSRCGDIAPKGDSLAASCRLSDVAMTDRQTQDSPQARPRPRSPPPPKPIHHLQRRGARGEGQGRAGRCAAIRHTATGGRPPAGPIRTVLGEQDARPVPKLGSPAPYGALFHVFSLCCSPAYLMAADLAERAEDWAGGQLCGRRAPLESSVPSPRPIDGSSSASTTPLGLFECIVKATRRELRGGLVAIAASTTATARRINPGRGALDMPARRRA